jgi:hypothetical protein
MSSPPLKFRARAENGFRRFRAISSLPGKRNIVTFSTPVCDILSFAFLSFPFPAEDTDRTIQSNDYFILVFRNTNKNKRWREKVTATTRLDFAICIMTFRKLQKRCTLFVFSFDSKHYYSPSQYHSSIDLW